MVTTTLFSDVTRHYLKSPKGAYQLRKAKRLHYNDNPLCACCGAKRTFWRRNDVHHIVPVHVNPALALDPDNLMTMCRRCHQMVGHSGLGWSHFNKTVHMDVLLMESAYSGVRVKTSYRMLSLTTSEYWNEWIEEAVAKDLKLTEAA